MMTQVHKCAFCVQVYPSWWGHHHDQSQPHAEQDRGSKPQPRPVPRLAYSVPQQPEQDLPLYRNDLITAAYLDVPSSGYAAVNTAPTAKRALNWEESALSTDSCAGQVLSGKENTTGRYTIQLRPNTKTEGIDMLL